MDIVLATKNRDKLEELKSLLAGLHIGITSLFEHPEIPDIVEDGVSFEENARKKARAVAHVTAGWALADDSGLVVDALGGKPGIYSARFAGKQGDYAANNAKLIEVMRDVPDEKRGAAFVCAMVLIAPDGKEWAVEGRCEGTILREPKGNRGFGYDPLFFISEEGRTMAELPSDRKNEISHRGKALKQIKKVFVDLTKKNT